MAKDEKPKAKKKTNPPLTDKERHKRFVDVAHEIGADETPESFDTAFEKIAKPKRTPS